MPKERDLTSVKLALTARDSRDTLKTAAAVFGLLISLITFFGKDQLKEHWEAKAKQIQALDEELTRSSSSAEQVGLMREIHSDLSVLVLDTLALEEHRDPSAIRNRYGHQGDYITDDIGYTRDANRLNEAEEALKALVAIKPFTETGERWDPDLGRAKDLLASARSRAKYLSNADISDILIRGKAKNLPDELPQLSPVEKQSQLRAFNRAVQELIETLKPLTTQIVSQARIVKKQQEHKAELADSVVAIVFVLGLILSLVGKISGLDIGKES